MESICTQSTPVTVGPRDDCAHHAEDILIARYHPGIADHGFEWPEVGITLGDFRNKEGIIARLGGVIVGRAILDREFYPLAELVNLEVAPGYRGRGVGSAIVRHAIETAARLGFLAIHAQVFKNEVPAQRLYARHAFLAATQGEMLRIWRFLNLPVLEQFSRDHPMAVFETLAGGEPRAHLLRWRDPLSDDELEVTLTGGSCQFDSDGVGPAVSALRLRCSRVRLTGTLDAIRPVRTGGAFAVGLSLANEGDCELPGGFRIGVNTGLRIADHPGGERFSLSPGASLKRTVMVHLTDTFPAHLLRISSYQSVPVSVDFLLEDHTFWLAGQAKIAQ
jgi:GNAT superfamily N-acetyltransferase